MRKEVKRSLLLWPAIASLTISGLSLFQTADSQTWDSVKGNAKFAWRALGGSKMVEPYLAESSNVVTAASVPAIPPLPEVGPAPSLLYQIIPPPQSNVELVERIDQGAPAMQVPERLVADANTASESPSWWQLAQNSATALVKSVRNAEDQLTTLTKGYFIDVDLAGPASAIATQETTHSDSGNSADPAVIVLLEKPAENEITIYEVSPVNQPQDDREELENVVKDATVSPTTDPSVATTPDPDLVALLSELAPPALSDADESRDKSDASLASLEPAKTTETIMPKSITDLGDLAAPQQQEIESVPALSEVNEPSEMIEASPASLEPAETVESIMPKSIANLGDLAASQPQEIEPVPAVTGAEVKQPESTREVADVNPASWPLTPQLDKQLKHLASLSLHQKSSETNHLVSASTSIDPAVQWTQGITDRLEQLRALDRLGNPRAEQLLEELAVQADQGLVGAEGIVEREGQIAWLRTAHALKRRIAVWKPVFRIVSDAGASVSVSIDRVSIQPSIELVRSDLETTGDANGWNQFLMLDQISAAAQSDDNDQRNDVAKRFLKRIHADDLHSAHHQWLQRESIDQLRRAIRPWTAKAIDYAAFLSKIEQQESEPINMLDGEISEVVHALRMAENPHAGIVVEAIETHYRNANMRMSVSEPMMQRLLPKLEPHTMPMRTQIFSTRVNGVTRVDSELKVDLQPANDRWLFTLETHGKMKTQSTGSKGTTSVSTSRQSEFLAATPIEVSTNGVEIKDSNVDVTGATRLRGIRTNYDSWPLFGSLIRNVAETQYYERAGAMNRIANRRIKSQLGNEITNRLGDRMELRSSQVRESVLNPLDQLRLDPRVVELQTTEERLTARYRLAGEDQLAAFTPRPRAPKSSLMSVQVHQSAVNNTMEHLVPRDQSKTIDELIVQGLSIFGVTDPELPSDLPEGVVIQFAKTRPITVEIEDGVMWMTLRIVKLTRDRMKLSRFIVRAAYRPEIDGINAYLARDGHLRISGPGMSMRERFPVRAIFNKVLATSRKFPITVPGLTSRTNTEDLIVSQLELRDGWIAMAISEVDAPRIALKAREE